MEKTDKDRVIKNIDDSIKDLEEMMETSKDVLAKLKKLRDKLTGQTKLKV